MITKDYVINNKELMKEWNWEKNNALGFLPDKLTLGCGKKVWWKCYKGHEWDSTISHRSAGRKCPYCSNKKILRGYNDLTTTHPKIVKDWDYEKNGALKPWDVSYGSTRNVYWMCENKHSWQAKISDRCRGNGCPICANKKVVKGINDLATTHPEIAKDWDYDNNGSLTPENVTYGCDKKVHWVCHQCGYKWVTTPNHRTCQNGTNCPSCSNHVVTKGKNDLATLYPEIAKKWNYELNKYTPDKVFPFSNKKAWWICDKDKRHIFETVIYHMTDGSTICPICSNQKIIVGVNDLATTHPELLKEWDYEKNTITPQQVTYGATKKVWWKCERMHNWQATIASRASLKTSCPYCKSELKVSVPEKALAFYLSKNFEIEESKHFEWLNTMELDIYIPSLKLGIEYDGSNWHKDVTRDLLKDNLCEKNNVTLIRVREDGCPNYLTTAKIIHIIKSKDSIKHLQDMIEVVFNYLNQSFNTNLNVKPDIEKDYFQIINDTLTILKEKSITNSDLINEWNYKKNQGLDPAMISLGMHKRVWWICKKGHEWSAMVYSRASGVGCPYCSGQKVLTGYNDLQTLCPEIAKEWNYRRNGKILPSQVRPQSNIKFWWVCSTCGNEWPSTPSHRFRGRGCPKCARQKTISSHFKKIINIETGIIYNSIKEASTALKVYAGGISNCCRGVAKTAGGYHWRYVEDKKD